MIDCAAMQWEDAFDALAEADFSDRDGIAQTGVVTRDESAFENLDALFFAFLDFDVDLQSVTRAEDGDIRSEVFLDEIAK